GEVAPGVPSAAGRHPGRHPAVEDLRGPGLLTDHDALKAALVEEAQLRGFDAIAVTRPDAIPQANKDALARFLAAGCHGDMGWLPANPERRSDPRILWSEVRSIVMLGLNYGPSHDPLAILQQRDVGAISVYARGDDYHELIKKALKGLARWLIEKAGGDVKV